MIDKSQDAYALLVKETSDLSDELVKIKKLLGVSTAAGKERERDIKWIRKRSRIKERDAIVSWLRKKNETVYHDIANKIERGDHTF